MIAIKLFPKEYRIRKIMAEAKVLSVLSVIFSKPESCTVSMRHENGVGIRIHTKKGKYSFRRVLKII